MKRKKRREEGGAYKGQREEKKKKPGQPSPRRKRKKISAETREREEKRHEKNPSSKNRISFLTALFAFVLTKDVIDIDKYSDEVDGLSQAKRLKEAEAWYGSALGRHSFAEVLAAHGLKPYMHSVMCGWLFEVCHMADLEIETFILSVALMSRYLIRSVVPDNERQEEGGEEEVQKETKESRALEVHPTLLIDPDNLQLLGIVSLFIAFKFTEASERLNLSSLARLAEGAWDKSELRAKEMIILNVLDFRLCIPTPLHFLPRFTLAAFLMDHFAHQDDDLRKKNDSRRIASDNDVHKTTLFFIHVAFSTSPSFFEIPPSLITAASIVLSRAVHHLPVWSRTFLHHCGYSKDQINLVIDEIVGETMHCPPQLSWRFGEGIHSESTRLAIAASEGALDALKK